MRVMRAVIFAVLLHFAAKILKINSKLSAAKILKINGKLSAAKVLKTNGKLSTVGDKVRPCYVCISRDRTS